MTLPPRDHERPSTLRTYLIHQTRKVSISISTSANSNTVRLEVAQETKQYDVHYASDDVALAPRPEGAVAGLLLVAMAAGKDIHVNGPIDPVFHNHIETVQDVYTTWSPSLSRIQVTADGERQAPGPAEAAVENPIIRNPTSADAAAPGRSAMFFSGGGRFVLHVPKAPRGDRRPCLRARVRH